MPSKETWPAKYKSKKEKNQRVRIDANDQPPAETNEPFEQDAKRRSGHHSGTAMPPLMKN